MASSLWTSLSRVWSPRRQATAEREEEVSAGDKQKESLLACTSQSSQSEEHGHDEHSQKHGESEGCGLTHQSVGSADEEGDCHHSDHNDSDNDEDRRTSRVSWADQTQSQLQDLTMSPQTRRQLREITSPRRSPRHGSSKGKGSPRSRLKAVKRRSTAVRRPTSPAAPTRSAAQRSGNKSTGSTKGSSRSTVAAANQGGWIGRSANRASPTPPASKNNVNSTAESTVESTADSKPNQRLQAHRSSRPHGDGEAGAKPIAETGLASASSNQQSKSKAKATAEVSNSKLASKSEKEGVQANSNTDSNTDKQEAKLQLWQTIDRELRVNIGNSLRCGICLSTVINPYCTPCVHVYCQDCLYSAIRATSRCPECKTEVTRRSCQPMPHMDGLAAAYKQALKEFALTPSQYTRSFTTLTQAVGGDSDESDNSDNDDDDNSNGGEGIQPPPGIAGRPSKKADLIEDLEEMSPSLAVLLQKTRNLQMENQEMGIPATNAESNYTIASNNTTANMETQEMLQTAVDRYDTAKAWQSAFDSQTAESPPVEPIFVQENHSVVRANGKALKHTLEEEEEQTQQNIPGQQEASHDIDSTDDNPAMTFGFDYDDDSENDNGNENEDNEHGNGNDAEAEPPVVMDNRPPATLTTPTTPTKPVSILRKSDSPSSMGSDKRPSPTSDDPQHMADRCPDISPMADLGESASPHTGDTDNDNNNNNMQGGKLAKQATSSSSAGNNNNTTLATVESTPTSSKTSPRFISQPPGVAATNTSTMPMQGKPLMIMTRTDAVTTDISAVDSHVVSSPSKSVASSISASPGHPNLRTWDQHQHANEDADDDLGHDYSESMVSVPFDDNDSDRTVPMEGSIEQLRMSLDGAFADDEAREQQVADTCCGINSADELTAPYGTATQSQEEKESSQQKDRGETAKAQTRAQAAEVKANQETKSQPELTLKLKHDPPSIHPNITTTRGSSRSRSQSRTRSATKTATTTATTASSSVPQSSSGKATAPGSNAGESTNVEESGISKTTQQHSKKQGTKSRKTLSKELNYFTSPSGRIKMAVLEKDGNTEETRQSTESECSLPSADDAIDVMKPPFESDLSPIPTKRSANAKVFTNSSNDHSHDDDTDGMDRKMPARDDDESLAVQEREHETQDGACMIPVGTIVEVQSRTWPGVNKIGGVARIIKANSVTSTYDVRYVLGGRELDVDAVFVRPHDVEAAASIIPVAPQAARTAAATPTVARTSRASRTDANVAANANVTSTSTGQGASQRNPCRRSRRAPRPRDFLDPEGNDKKKKSNAAAGSVNLLLFSPSNKDLVAKIKSPDPDGLPPELLAQLAKDGFDTAGLVPGAPSNVNNDGSSSNGGDGNGPSTARGRKRRATTKTSRSNSRSAKKPRVQRDPEPEPEITAEVAAAAAAETSPASTTRSSARRKRGRSSADTVASATSFAAAAAKAIASVKANSGRTPKNKKAKHVTKSLIFSTVPKFTRAQQQKLAQRRYQQLFEEHKVIHVLQSSLNDADMKLLRSLVTKTKNLSVQLRICENFSKNISPTICVMPVAEQKKQRRPQRKGRKQKKKADNATNRLTANSRTLKAMRSALDGIPIVSPDWIYRLSKAGKVSAPDSEECIQTLPTKTDGVESMTTCGITSTAAKLQWAKEQQAADEDTNAQEIIAPLRNCSVLLIASFAKEKRSDMHTLITEAGGDVINTASAAVSKLNALSGEESSQRIVLLCDDSASTVPSGIAKAVEQATAKGHGGDIMVVHSAWVFDCITCSAMLDAKLFAPKSKKGKHLWEMCQK